ncbi:hypothetical protein B0J13DRAFT_47647 [Dactylonectria estremocensis]|uniref:AAA+ ATPase domain-containing protein n=1 Tax=Dactylonectria estremocensis TaxID=1079267 RepID=A0A9P9EU08_9HYPO|nr:hypothetical protein B0J13DRAFT_47647 [Dactylonectria estremocensis]
MMEDETVSRLPTTPLPTVEAEGVLENGQKAQHEAFQPDPGLKDTEENGKDFEKLLNSAAEVLDDNHEDFATTLRDAANAQYSIAGTSMFKLEKEQGRLELRSKQATLHLTFTELRISELERELQALKIKVLNLPPQKEQKSLACQPILKRSEVDEFRITVTSTKIPIQDRPSLEVLYSNGIPVYDLDSTDPPQMLTRRATARLGYGDSVTAPLSVPERLRLRSCALIAHLRNISRESVSRILDHTFRDSTERWSPSLILRPFKLLVIYEHEIRESVEEIESLIQSAQEQGSEKKDMMGKWGGISYQYDDLLRDLQLLITFLDTDMKSTFDLRKDIKNGTATEIEYADLWHLFDLGDIVVSQSDKEQAYKVLNFTGGRPPLVDRTFNQESKTPPLRGFTIDCCRLRFDGTHYVPEVHTLSISKFTGRRAIRSLEVYPLKLHADSKNRRDEFMFQGRRYVDIISSSFCHRMYRGRTLDEPPQDLEAQVIVDMVMAVKAEPGWSPKTGFEEDDLTKNDLRETQIRPACGHNKEGCCGSDFIFKDQTAKCFVNASFQRDYGGLLVPRSAEELKEDIILLPNWVHGFVLRLRQWVTLRVSDLSDVAFENDFNQLMISETHKETVLALVQTHENTKMTSSHRSQSLGASLDLVKGKGTGLILLLHGEPGVGKTSTAECVADKTKRPLFPITCGDIGETAMEVETKLQLNFRLAHRWGCVLLLDEADVFLAKRNKTDLRRNAVTSVFLRCLEYYAGILFLTTNRVGGIDPAFKSRIHLSLYYSRLDLETTLKLYENLVIKTKEEQRKSGAIQFQIKHKEIVSFAKRHFRGLQKEGYNTWNGRQIRNAFQTSIALVENQVANISPGQPKPVLGKEQFKVVAQGSREFDSYLMRTLQGADDEIAIRDQWRDDRFEADVAQGTFPGPAFKSGQKPSRATTIPRGKSRKPDESLSETESESGSESDSEVEDEDEDNCEVQTAEKANTAAPEVDLADYEEFLKFKAMLKARGK